MVTSFTGYTKLDSTSFQLIKENAFILSPFKRKGKSMLFYKEEAVEKRRKVRNRAGNGEWGKLS